MRAPEGRDSQISRQSDHASGKVVSTTHRPLLLQQNTPGTQFCYRLSRNRQHNALVCQQTLYWRIVCTNNRRQQADIVENALKQWLYDFIKVHGKVFDHQKKYNVTL
jgi:hypothetical protein